MAYGNKLAPRAFVGNGAAYMVGRLSYTFGLTGRKCTDDTLLSTKLIHVSSGASYPISRLSHIFCFTGVVFICHCSSCQAGFVTTNVSESKWALDSQFGAGCRSLRVNGHRLLLLAGRHPPGPQR